MRYGLALPGPAALAAALALAPAAWGQSGEQLEMYTLEGSADRVGEATAGVELAGAPQDPEGIEGPNRNDWDRRGGPGIREGAAVATADTPYLGFGLEGISDAATRRDVMGRAITHLLR